MAETEAVKGPTTETEKEFDFRDWLEDDGGFAGRASHYGMAIAGGAVGGLIGKFVGNDQPLAKGIGALVGAVAMYKLGPEFIDDVGDAMKSVNQDIENGKLEKGINLKERFSRVFENIATKDGQTYQASNVADPDPDPM